jgi:hypothetical protein
MSLKLTQALPALGLLGLAALASPAAALPSFAVQTGSACADCHVGGYGPQLTAYGRKFKMQGYGSTQSWSVASNSWNAKIPVSMMADALYTHTDKDLSSAPAPHTAPNDNTVVQEIGFFLAGRLAPGFGAFVQATYSGVDRVLHMDNMDLRVAREIKLAGHDAVVGVSVNNNPTVQDPWNSTPAWGYPFLSSALAPGPTAAPLISGGLGQQVLGVTPYLWLNDSFYLEAGGYGSLGADFLKRVNVSPGPPIDGLAPYWRVVYQKDWGDRNASIGAFGLSANLIPDGSVPRDHYQDTGVDATWQYVGTGKNVFNVNASYINEHQSLDGTFALGGADQPGHDLRSYNVNASYYRDRKYGVTAGLFGISGTRDFTLYAPAQDTGSLNGKPDSNGYILQADFTPFGGPKSWGKPYANFRFGVQYTGFTKFNGASSNYDGFGRKASDNNSTVLFAWTTF